MTQIKKFAWYGSSVALAAVMAVALVLAGPLGTAHAAAITGTTALNYLIGSSVENGITVVNVTAAATNSAVPNSGTITVTFPAGTTFGAGATTAANWSIGDTGIDDDTGIDEAEAPASVTISGTSLTFTLDASSTIAATEGFTIATGGAGLIKWGQTGGNISVSTSGGDSGTIGTVTLTGVTVSASPNSIAADGVSTSTISVAASGATNANGDTVSVVVTGGQLIGATPGGGGVVNAVAAAPTAGSPQTTTVATTPTGAVNTTAGTFVFRSGSTAGAASFTIYVTPASGGQAQIAGAGQLTLTTPSQTAPGLPAAGSVTPTTAVSVTSTATTPNITATFVDANNQAPISGGVVTVSTSLGVLNAVTPGLTCTNQSCLGTLPVGGAVTVTLTGGGVSGSANVTFTTNGVSVTKQVTIVGAVSALTAKTQVDADGAGAGTTFVDAATPSATTFATGAGVRVSVDPVDASGNRVPGVAPVITVAPATCATVGAVTPSTSSAPATAALTAGSAAAGTTCTITATSGSRSTTATFTIGSALAATSVLTVNAEDMALVSTQTITVNVASAGGVPVGDNTTVTLVVMGGALVSNSALTRNGVASFTYVSPGTAQSVNATAVAGSATGSASFSVGGAAPTPGAGSFTGTIADSGVSIVSFDGGSVASLAAAAEEAGLVSVWVTVEGNFVGYIVGAPAFVNAAFNAQFADGVPAGTLAIVVK